MTTNNVIELQGKLSAIAGLLLAIGNAEVVAEVLAEMAWSDGYAAKVGECNNCGEAILKGQDTYEADRSEGEHYGTATVHANCEEPEAATPDEEDA